MGEALLETYQDLFHINANPTDSDRSAIEGKFKSALNAADRVAELQAMTFFALLKLADLDLARKRQGGASHLKRQIEGGGEQEDTDDKEKNIDSKKAIRLNLGYKIEVHLPATKDIEVYNVIFRSLRENILE